MRVPGNISMSSGSSAEPVDGNVSFTLVESRRRLGKGQEQKVHRHGHDDRHRALDLLKLSGDSQTVMKTD